MYKQIFRQGILLVLLLLSLFVTASAQEFRGSVTGKVTDPNGAVIPGATVTIKNIETNSETTTTTNDEGTYNFPLLQPGKYTLTVTQQGFNTAVREGIEIKVADKLALDVPMEIGVAATVTTVTTSPILETGTVSTGTVVTSQQISELPLAEGTAYQLATLAPGVSYTGNPAFVGPTSNGNLAAFRSSGSTGANQITLDGSPNYAFDGGVGFSPPADAVQEFKVQTNAFDAQQGYTAGANVNVAVKSGTNDLHGSAYYFNRDRSRTANNFFGNRSGQDRPERTYHRFGGVVSGPVYLPKLYNGRNKTFFLFSYERLKDNIAEPQLFTVPTLKMRNGDFTELITNPANLNATVNNIPLSAGGVPVNTIIYNPFSGTQSGNNVVRSTFGCPTGTGGTGVVPLPAGSTCNIIPASLFNPVAVNLLKFYPAPNTTGIANGTQSNFFSNSIRRQNYRGLLARIDHKISENQTIFGKYYHSFNPEDRQDWAGVVNGFPITKGFEFRTNDGGNVDYTNTLSSTTVLDVRVSFNRFAQERRPVENFDPATLGFAPASLAAMRGYQYLPRIMIRNLDATRPIRSTLGATRSDWNSGRLRPFMMGSIQPTVTKLWGDHTAKAGYDLRIVRENFVSPGYQGGQFFFDGTFTSPASNSSSSVFRNVFGRDIAAFLLGIPTTGSGSNVSQIDNPQAYSVQSVYHGIFFQDDWRISPTVTLNFGLRYEMEGGVTERYNRLLRGFDLSTPSPIEAQVIAAYTTAYNADPNRATNFPVPPDQFHVRGGYTFADSSNRAAWDTDKRGLEPRFGASWQVNPKTVVRGGFGIFMAPFQIETPRQVGFSNSTPFVPSTNNGLTFRATLTNPFPGGVNDIVPSPGSSQGLLTNLGVDVATSSDPIIPVNRVNSKFMRVVVGFQRELPGQFIVEANYVAAHGYGLPVSRNFNFVPRSFLGADPTTDNASNTFLSGTIANPFRNIAPAGSPLNTATTITRAQSLSAFPEFPNVWIQQNNGTNDYRSLQIQVQRRFSKGYSLTASYTRSRLRERTNYLNPTDALLEDRVSPDDRPNRFTFSGIYELPLGRGRTFGKEMNRALDAVVGGWQLNGTYEWQSGEPFQLTAGQFYSAVDFTQLKAHVGENNGQGQKYGVDIPAFDTTAFVRLSSFGLRNVPTTLDNLRNQPFLNVNLSISKNFKIGENKRLQLRAEAINAFNHPYFALINLDPSNANFGFTTSQRNNPRDIQLGAKFVF